MAFLGSIATLGGLAQTPSLVASVLPLLAIGLTYYRYHSVDPESFPKEAYNVTIIDIFFL